MYIQESKHSFWINISQTKERDWEKGANDFTSPRRFHLNSTEFRFDSVLMICSAEAVCKARKPMYKYIQYRFRGSMGFSKPMANGAIINTYI